MIYENVDPPYTLPFREMSTTDLRNYFQWYIDNIPTRLILLNKFINVVYYPDFSLDFSPQSLITLGDFFCSEIELKDEITGKVKKLKNITGNAQPESSHKLKPTEFTYSLAYDIGMYFSQVLIKNNIGLRINLNLKNKKNMDYGQPVITGFLYKQEFNPHYMMLIQLSKLIRDSLDPYFLINLYEIWTGSLMIENNL